MTKGLRSRLTNVASLRRNAWTRSDWAGRSAARQDRQTPPGPTRDRRPGGSPARVYRRRAAARALAVLRFFAGTFAGALAGTFADALTRAFAAGFTGAFSGSTSRRMP